MGYIIPYTPYTYQQYARRMGASKDHPHYINRSYKAVFHHIKEENPNDRHKHLHLAKGKNRKKQKNPSRSVKGSEDFILTGKGGLLNASI